jgi:uncharacterized repeat protein (TIGR03803 family)
MKRCIKGSSMVAGLGSALVGQVKAQTFTVLHRFTGVSDGAFPEARLTLSGKTLYGTASTGGSGSGSVFALNTDGTGFTNLHSFSASKANSLGFHTNKDGAFPLGALILSANTLYGTTWMGGSSGGGTVFKVNTDGTGFANLVSFSLSKTNSLGLHTNKSGAFPHAGLVLSANTLYGTAQDGGSSGYGTVFKINTDGTGFTNLHTYALFDGGGPIADLLLSSNTLYGTTRDGGSSSDGTVFKLTTNGTSFMTVYEFTPRLASINSDGAWPAGDLVLSGNTLYGTASVGGSSGYGTVFKINTDGTAFTILHEFGGTDGAYPEAGLTLSGNTLFGTTSGGGSSGAGTVFAVNTNGTGFTNLHSFAAASTNIFGVYTNSDGTRPSGLILSGNTLYGVTSEGNPSGFGTVFSLSFQPQLTVVSSGTNVSLSWPTNFAGIDYTGYTLQSTTNLGSSAIWTTDLPAPVVVNGQDTVTIRISGTQRFFR